MFGLCGAASCHECCFVRSQRAPRQPGGAASQRHTDPKTAARPDSWRGRAAGDSGHHKGDPPSLEPPCPTCSSRPTHGQRHSGLRACHSTPPPMASVPKSAHNGPCEHGPCTSKAHSRLLSSSQRPSVLLPAPGSARTPRLHILCWGQTGQASCTATQPASDIQPLEWQRSAFPGSNAWKLSGRVAFMLHNAKRAPALVGQSCSPSSRTAEQAACQDRPTSQTTSQVDCRRPWTTRQHGMGLKKSTHTDTHPQQPRVQRWRERKAPGSHGDSTTQGTQVLINHPGIA